MGSMTFDEFVLNGTTVTVPVTITAPPYDPDPSNAKTAATKVVEQQWRDAKTRQLDKQLPLSLNRASSYVS